jgi:DNA-binding transcriptional MerR regulator
LPKSTEAFRNIGEVSAELGVRKHVLRFWEAKFPQLKPMKRGGGRRYYRPGDVQLLRGIKHLLQNAGYTIKGVQKILREDGVEDVKKLGGVPEARGAGGLKLVQAPPAGEAARSFSAADITVLGSVVTELEAVRTLLGGGDVQTTERGARARRSAGPR